MINDVIIAFQFIGVTEVDDVRGMDVVRQAMQKLKFSRHIKRSEGSKPPKVDLTINVNGLQIVDQRTKVNFLYGSLTQCLAYFAVYSLYVKSTACHSIYLNIKK